MVPITIVGRAEIVVNAITDGVRQQLQNVLGEVQGLAEQAGTDFGGDFGEAFGAELNDAVADAFRDVTNSAKNAGEESGQQFADSFRSSLDGLFDSIRDAAGDAGRDAGAAFGTSFSDEFSKSLGDADARGKDFGDRFGAAAAKAIANAVSGVNIPTPTPRTPRGGGPAPGGGAPSAPAPAPTGPSTDAQQKILDRQALLQEKIAEIKKLAQEKADAAAKLSQQKIANQAAEAIQKRDDINKAAQDALDNIEILNQQKLDDAKRAADQKLDAQKRAAAQKLADDARAAAQKLANDQVNDARKLANDQLNDVRKLQNEQLNDVRKLAAQAARAQQQRLDQAVAEQQRAAQRAAERAVVRAERDAERKRREAEREAKRGEKTEDQRAEARRKGQRGFSLEFLQNLLDKYDKEVEIRLRSDKIKEATEATEDLAYATNEVQEAQDAISNSNGQITQAMQDRLNLAQQELQVVQDRYDAAQKNAAVDQRLLDSARNRRDALKVKVVDLDLERDARQQGRRFRIALTEEFKAAARAAKRAFTILYGIGQVVGSAIGFAVGAVGSLVASLASVAAVGAQAAGALVTLPAILGALAQGAVTAAVAFKGVGSAISAGFKAADSASQGGGGGGGGDTGASARAIRDARIALSRAYEDSARRIRDANYDIADAEQELIERQQTARIAQEALTGARKRAAETLDDLALSVERASLNEEEAVLNLQRATQLLAETQANPASTAQDLQEASLNYRSAELSVREAQDALEDIEEAQDEAAAAGVEGSAEVVEAQNEIIQANNDVNDAEERLRRAREDRADAEVQNARAIEDAQRALSDALASQASSAGAAAQAADAYQEALNKLSPAARSFVEYVVSIKDEFTKLRDAAAEGLFGPLEQNLRDLVEKSFPALENMFRITGAAIGSFTTSLTAVLTESGFIERFTAIAEDNVRTIERFGEIIASVINGISGVLVAAGPLVDRFTAFLSEKAGDFERFATSGEGIGKMAVFFEKAGDTAAKFGEIIGNVTGGLIAIGEAAEPAGQALLDKWIEMSEKFEDFNSSVSRSQELETYFSMANENAVAVVGLLKDILGLFGSIADSPAIGQAANTLREGMIPPLERIIEALADTGDSLAELTVNVVEVLEAFTDSAGMEAFLDTLNFMVAAISTLLDTPLVSWLLEVTAPVIGLAHAVSLASIAFGLVNKVLVGTYLSLQKVWLTVGLTVIAFGQMAAAAWANVAAIVAANGGWLSGSGILALLTGAMGAAATAARALTVALVSNPFTLALVAVAALVAGVMSYANAQKEARERVQALSETIDAQTGLMTENTIAVYFEGLSDDIKKRLEEAGISLTEFGKAVSGSDADVEAFAKRITESDLGIVEQGKLIQDVSKEHKVFQDAITAAKKAQEEKNQIDSLAKEILGDNTVALSESKIAAMEAAEVNELVAKSAKEVSDAYEEAVDAYSMLNDSAITQERTAIRVAEANADLASDLKKSLTDITDQADSFDKLTDAQKALYEEQKNGLASLNITTEAGREARSTILDYVEALDKQLQANLDAGVPVEEATRLYDEQKEAFIRTATEAGITEQAVRDYITQVEATPGQKTTRFLAIIEEVALKQILEGLTTEQQAVFYDLLPKLGDSPSLAELTALAAEVSGKTPSAVIDVETRIKVENAKADALNEEIKALVTNKETGEPIYDISVLPQVDQDRLAAAKSELAALTGVGETGIPLDPTFLPRVNSSLYKNTQEQLQELLKDPNTGELRSPEYLPEEDREKYDTLRARLGALLVDPKTNRPYSPLYYPEKDVERYNALRAELARLEKGPDGNPWTADVSADDKGRIEEIKKEIKGIEDSPVTVPVNLKTSGPQTLVDVPGLKVIYDPTGRTLARPGVAVLRAAGGPIYGPGTSTSDSIPALLSNGEFVLSAKAVRAAGGMSVIERLHAMLRAGMRLPRFATGGAVRAPSKKPPASNAQTIAARVEETARLAVIGTVYTSVNKQSVNKAGSEIDRLMRDRKTRKARKAELFSELDTRSARQTSSALDKLMFKSDGDHRDPQYLPEADRKRYDQVQEELDRLLTDTVTGELREPQYLPEADRAKYELLRQELDSLLAKNDRTPYNPTYYPAVDTDKRQAAYASISSLMVNADKRPWSPIIFPVVDPVVRDIALAGLSTLVAMKTATSVFLRVDGRANYAARVKEGDRVIEAAQGGPIYGPGTSTSDSIPALLSNGEFVLSAKAVRALGGMNRATMLHNALSSGSPLMRLSSGGSSASAQGARAGDGKTKRERERGGVAVTIGTIVSPSPRASAREIVSAMRAEAYRMGQYS